MVEDIPMCNKYVKLELMRRIFFNCRLTRGCAMVALLSVLTLTSCIPDGGEESSNGVTQPETPTLPEGVKQISMFSGLGGGDLSGLYYNEDGFLISTNGWMLSSLGRVSGIISVDYIPRFNWQPQLYAEVGLGFVGYHPAQGFVAFLVASMALDELRNPVGVGMLYIPNFTTGSEPIELEATALNFKAEGGTETVELKGTKYSEYQISFSGDWLKATPASSIYSFIKDEIEVTVSPNTTDEPRTTTVMIGTEQGKITPLKITQEADQ